MNNIKIEVQYFRGCPNSKEVLNTVKKIIAESDVKINFEEILVETQEAAEKYKFRGSPTVLINGMDLENLPENKTPSLSCRYYQDGLPSMTSIRKVLNDIVNEHQSRNE